MLKRVISLTLSLVMVLGMMPLNIMATAEEVPAEEISVPETTAPVEAESVPEERIAEETFGEISETVPVETAPTYDAATSGTCGENLTWTLSTAGALSISGSGAMYDYDFQTQPWYSSRASIQKVVIYSGVTSVGDCAFYNLTNLTSLTLPDSIKTIGKYAFGSCKKLTTLTLPSKLETIKEGAFCYCSGLESITLPSGLKFIDSRAFDSCSSLLSIKIPDTVTYLGEHVFYSCSSLTEAVLPAGIQQVGQYTFNFCSKLASVAIPEGITSLGQCAFGGCSALTNITLPSTLTVIGDSAFSGCKGLNSLTIPAGVTSIGTYAFRGCSKLTNITIPDGVTYISDGMFYDCSGLKQIILPKNISSIGASAFYYCTGLTGFVIPDGVTSVGDRAFYLCSNLLDITIPGNVKSIGAHAFDRCRKLAKIVIPEGVAHIGDNIFEYCDVLESVELPESLTSIGSGAFFACGSLKEITIPKNVTNIGETAFSTCKSLTQITVASENTAYCSEDGILFNKDKTILIRYPSAKTGSYTVPDGVTDIANGAFGDCVNLSAVILPDTVSAIGVGAFSSCSGMVSILIPDSMTVIGDQAFYNCSSLTEIEIPDSVTSIGNRTFYNCSSLTEIEIPDSVISIGTYAFYRCNSLTDAVIGNSVTVIDNYAFCQCAALESIRFTGDAPVFLYDQDVGDLQQPFYQVTTTAYYPANNETWTEEVRQNYGGTITWKSYETGPKIIASGTFGDNLTWTLDDEGKLTVSGEGFMTWSGNAPWYDYRDSVKTAVIEDGITGLVSNAFSRYENLTTVKLSDTVEYIGEHAFAWCDSLTDVTMSSAVTEIREGAFRNCGSLTHITIPATVSSICSYAFAYCANLSGITVDEANPYYSSDENGVLFNEAKTQLLKCPGTLSGTYTIPDSVTEIEACAFSSCANLTGVEIPDALRVIESYAFDGCTGLTEVTLPASVTALGTKTFDNCTGLQKIYFEGNAPKHFAGTNVVDLFGSTTATVYYPADNETWTEEVRQNYGGTVTWKLYCVGEHTEVIDAGVAATCTTDGLTEGKHCSTCGEVLVAQEVIPAGHNVTYGICPDCGVFVGGSPYLQLLPDTFFSCENLYTKLNPVKGYYTATNYDTSNGDVISVVIPVEPGDRIAASSFASVSENMGTVNGIRVTYLKGDTIVTSVSAKVVYDTYTKNGYITVPDGVDAVCIPWWAPSNANWMTLAQISKNYSVHSPVSAPAQAPTCTENGYTAGEICEICGISLGTREEIPADGHKYSGNSCTICGAVNLMAILDGKYVSVLGDSISTFNGYSNDATVNSTIGGNAPRYDAGSADTKPGSYCLLESVNSTWWMDFANRSGMQLLVNNSWAGSQVFGGQTSDGRVIPPAYLERCINLHDNTTDNNPENEPISPDVIFVYLGINDYNFNRDQVGSGGVDYAKLVNSDGSYVVPTSFGEAYGILLHKMQAAYPNAQIFAMTLLPENLYSVNMTAWEQHNAYIRAAAQYYNVPVVDLAADCAITWENYSGYMIDKIHPTTAGMKLIADCIEETLQAYYKANPPHTHTPVIDEAVDATCTTDGLTEGKHCSACGEVLVKQEVIPAGHTVENGICTGCEAYGTCGEKLIWTLNEDGVLTVSGTGTMNDYMIYSADAPWHEHQESVKKVIIGEGVTSIGAYAFNNHQNLAEVIIPDSVTEIGDSAFVNCDSLTAVEIPDSVTAIDNEAFYHCSGLKKLTIGNSVKEIAYFAFGYCVGLTEVVIPDNVTSIGERAFSYCSGLTTAVIGDGVTSIGNAAFAECRRLTEIVIPDGVTSISDHTFSQCNSLTKVVIPDSVTSIGIYAFEYCYKLSEIVIPDSVTSIGERAFSYCNALTEIVIPNGVTHIGDFAFHASMFLTEITFEGDVPGFENDTFAYITATAYYPAGNETWTEEVRQNYGGEITWVATCTDGHTEVIDEAVEATCTTDGLTEGKHCELCGRVLVEQETVPATGHSTKEVPAVEPTDDAEGNIAHYACESCGKLFADYEGKIELTPEEVILNRLIRGAAIDDKYYDTVSEALAAAQAGNTVKLMRDTSEVDVVIHPGVTLDLNGHSLTAEYVFTVKNSSLIDSSAENTGILKVDPDCASISPSNSQLPVWTGEGFVFTEITKFQEVYRTTAEGLPQYIFSPTFESIAHQYLVQGAESSRIRIAIRMTWEIETGTAFQNFVFNDATVKTIIDSFTGSYYKSAFYATITDSKYANFKLQVIMISDTGVELACN